jgi:hypothetical protein
MFRIRFKNRQGYFQQSKEWKVTNSLTMVLLLAIISGLPKMINGPDAKKEMNEIFKSAAGHERVLGLHIR